VAPDGIERLGVEASAGVTDHGALTGLTDDDHTGYLLATGTRTGASSQAQTFTSGIIGPSWKPASNSTTALQLQNAAGTAIATVDTTNGRFGIGVSPPGYPLDVITTAAAAAARFENQRTAGTNYGMLGGTSGSGATKNIGIAFYAIGATYNIQMILGNSGAPNASYTVYAPNLDPNYFGGSLGIGTTSPATLLHGLLTSAATNAVTNVLTLGHDTTGTAAAGFGAGQLFTLESSTTAAQSAARIQALWYEATHATRKADLVLTAYDSGGEREGLRIRADGSGPALGFYGVAPIARAVLATGAGATVDNVITALQNLGLVKQS